MKIVHVVGARPNFMKAAPVLSALRERSGVDQKLVHTGQHYDSNMSDVFFRELQLPDPDVNLGVGSASHAEQTAKVMIGFESVVMDDRPDLVLVYGDVNSTVAAALVCAKLGIGVGHVEAGLRSRDRGMPEEINRIVTDQLSDLLFTPSKDADENLAAEGIPSAKIHFVGNVMIDSLTRCLPLARKPSGLELPDRYLLVTLHRPSNVDVPNVLSELFGTLLNLARRVPVLFPVHPRTRRVLDGLLTTRQDGVDLRFLEPLSYLEFLHLERSATAVITDSGGVQEETTYLGVPCMTVRETTERPVTVTSGTNLVVGRDMALLEQGITCALDGEWKRPEVPPLWDGRAAQRIADIVGSRLS